MAEDLSSGAHHTFGSNCHFQATGVDTRLARVQLETEGRDQRVRGLMPVSELNILDQLVDVAQKILKTGEVNRYTETVLARLVTWDRSWSASDIGLVPWLVRALSNESADRCEELREAMAADGIDMSIIHDGKLMRSRFAGQCASCGAAIVKGDEIIYNGEAHCVSHREPLDD